MSSPADFAEEAASNEQAAADVDQKQQIVRGIQDGLDSLIAAMKMVTKDSVRAALLRQIDAEDDRIKFATSELLVASNALEIARGTNQAESIFRASVLKESARRGPGMRHLGDPEAREELAQIIRSVIASVSFGDDDDVSIMSARPLASASISDEPGPAPGYRVCKISFDKLAGWDGAGTPDSAETVVVKRIR